MIGGGYSDLSGFDPFSAMAGEWVGERQRPLKARFVIGPAEMT
jgi:hypothetical protein